MMGDRVSSSRVGSGRIGCSVHRLFRAIGSNSVGLIGCRLNRVLVKSIFGLSHVFHFGMNRFSVGSDFNWIGFRLHRILVESSFGCIGFCLSRVLVCRILPVQVKSHNLYLCNFINLVT